MSCCATTATTHQRHLHLATRRLTKSANRHLWQERTRRSKRTRGTNQRRSHRHSRPQRHRQHRFRSRHLPLFANHQVVTRLPGNCTQNRCSQRRQAHFRKLRHHLPTSGQPYRQNSRICSRPRTHHLR